MATVRRSADQVRAQYVARERLAQEPRPHRQAALARGAGLPRDEAGTRARSLRRPHLAWISSPRNALLCRPRLSRPASSAFPPGGVSNGRSLRCAGSCSKSCCAGWARVPSAAGASTSRRCHADRHGCDQVVLVPNRGWRDEGEGEAEDGAAAGGVGVGQLAAVEAGDLGRDPEAETVAALAFGGEERLEDPF